MAEHNGPDFEKYSGLQTPEPWYTKIISAAKGCEFAIIGIIALIALGKNLPEHFAYASLASVAVLGIASAMIRKRE